MRYGVRWITALACATLALFGARPAAAQPAQNLPSALLIFPYINSDGGGDTRVELLNLSGEPQELQCFWVYGDSCSEIGFFIDLTPYQPVSFLASRGLFEAGGSAVPGFFGEGELKCAVVATQPEPEAHNAIQGRATVYQSDGETVSYSAVGFRRLSSGPYTGIVHLNGSEYAACPNRLHFEVLTDDSPASEMILVPCDQDLILQIATELNVQFLVTNEFEQTFSASINMECTGRLVFSDLGAFFSPAALGTATAHISLRGVQGPLLGLVIDAVNFFGATGTAGNEPSFEGNRSATVKFPAGRIDD